MLFTISACSSGGTPVSQETNVASSVPDTPAPEVSPTPTETLLPPTPTPLPLALTVNGENILLSDFQAALVRFQSALEEELTPEEIASRVMNDLIDQVLLAQAAKEAGFVISDEIISERMDQLVAGVGGEGALLEWMETNGYTPEQLREELRRVVPAAWMRDQVMDTLPGTIEQVHARQILLYNLEEAQEVHDELDSGTEFDALISIYEPITLGELGWFPRGYLLEPTIEEVAFSLDVGAYSEVIETDLGYHIVQVIERNAEQPLDYDVRFVLQAQILQNWLLEQRESSEIQVWISP